VRVDYWTARNCWAVPRTRAFVEGISKLMDGCRNTQHRSSITAILELEKGPVWSGINVTLMLYSLCIRFSCLLSARSLWHLPRRAILRVLRYLHTHRLHHCVSQSTHGPAQPQMLACVQVHYYWGAQGGLVADLRMRVSLQHAD